MNAPDIIELSPTRHIYPEFRYRDWEQVRRPFEKAFASQLEAVLDENNIQENAVCLDFASGEGQGAVLLDMANRSTVIGADIDAKALSDGRWIGDDDNSRVIADMYSLPFKDGAFNVVLSISGLHTIDDSTGKMAREIARVLAPNGICIATNDTARPSGYVMSFSHLVANYNGNRLLPSYDKYENITVCKSVPIALYEAAKKAIINDVGITQEQFDEASRIIFSKAGDHNEQIQLEKCLMPIVCEAIALVEQKTGELSGYNPFEKSLLSRLFNDLYAARLDVTERRFVNEQACESIELDIPAIGRMYARIMERDELGNVRYKQLSREPHTDYVLRTKSCFTVGIPDLS